MDMIIRRAKKEDAEALTLLAMLSKQSNGYDDAFMRACADELRVTPALLETHEYWAAESGILCGFACLQVDLERAIGEVTSLFIHPNWQRRGVGRRLWATIEKSAHKKRLTALRLDADPAAEKFYHNIGFSTVGRIPSGSIPGRTLPHMRIVLSA